MKGSFVTMVDLSVIVPCFNEEKNIGQLVATVINLFKQKHIKGELILVDDGSSDRTRELNSYYSQQFENVKCVSHRENLGIPEAWATGLKYSRGKYIVTVDADMQYKPEDILTLYDQIVDNNYDLVQGWREKYKDNKVLRKILSHSLSCLLNLLFFTRINDIKSGFVVYKREVFYDVLEDRKKYTVFQHFFILCAIKKRYTLKQIPITFYPRIRGKSSVNNPFLLSCKVLSDIPQALIDYGISARKKKRRKS